MKVFNGIRYAVAKRLQMPVMEPDIESIEKVECKEIICPQSPSKLEHITGPILSGQEQGEDCLRLAIHTPSLDGKRPVLVFIHGGAFVAGSGLLPIYDASDLAETLDAVVVNISYRLGAFGFLCMIDKGVINLGIEDQKCALRWIQRNIAKFGGDPEDITVTGQSGGAYCIGYIATTTQDPLFKRANLMSAPFGSVISYAKGEEMTQKYLSILGKDIHKATIQEILDAQNELIRQSPKRPPFGPVGDNDLRSKCVMPSLKRVFLSCSIDDALPLTTKALPILAPLFSYLIFKRPAQKFGQRLAKQDINATFMTFNWRHKEGPYGTAHCIGLPLLFSSWEKAKDVPMLFGTTEREFNEHSHRARSLMKRFMNDQL